MALGLGCSSRPGTSRANRTGSWRTFRPVFSREKCTKCRLCVQICPGGCIVETAEGYFEPDYDYCKGCGLCAEECAGEAIEMQKEEK
ncbi:MAG: 4Fe-4S binding protein [Methanolinea sp.]